MQKFKEMVITDGMTLAPPYIINRTMFLGDCSYDRDMCVNWPTDDITAHHRMMEYVKKFLDRCDRLMDYEGRWFSQRAPEDTHIYVDPRCNTSYYHSLGRLG